MSVSEMVRLSIFAALSPDFCAQAFAETLVSFHEEPEATLRFITLMRGTINHIRNRERHPGLLLSLLSAARFRDSEQTWITLLAYLLRINHDLPSRIAEQLIRMADDAATKAGEAGSVEDKGIYMPGVLLNRTKLYKSYVRAGDRVDDEKLYLVPALYGSDMAAEGENVELLAFENLRQGNKEEAANCFDYAATSFYLRGLWKSGQLNEWAANNVENLMEIARKNTLMIRPEGTYQAPSAVSFPQVQRTYW